MSGRVRPGPGPRRAHGLGTVAGRHGAGIVRAERVAVFRTGQRRVRRPRGNTDSRQHRHVRDRVELQKPGFGSRVAGGREDRQASRRRVVELRAASRASGNPDGTVPGHQSQVHTVH